jgi:putative tryptophan/tyrosine transport system substrate-binding protein
MRRRTFIAALGGAAAWPLVVRAQQSTRVIGLLGAVFPEDIEVARNLTALRQGLADTGYIEGKNIQIEYRWARGDYERLPQLAAELVARNVDVIVNEGGRPTVIAAKNATSKIPIVFHTGFDPVADGLVASLARPGGNLTGVSVLTIDLMPKQLQLLSELVPKATAIALLFNPNNPPSTAILTQVREAADSRRMLLHVLEARTEREIDAAFAVIGRSPNGALIVGADAFFTTRRDQIVGSAARHSVPTIYSQTLFSRAGGLLSYGPSIPVAYRLKGNYTGKILNGAKAADLPVQQTTTLDLVINLKTAKALGLDLPPSLLARADEVIE